jgi:hypothetical protein
MLTKAGHRMFDWLRRKRSQNLEVGAGDGSIPSVKFDPSRVTNAVKVEIKRCVGEIAGPTTSQRNAVYDAALQSVSAGRDFHTLYAALIELGIDGMTKSKASAIALRINNRATALMNRSQQNSLGIEHARWMYSGAPCMVNPKKPSLADIEQNDAHKSADRKRFNISEGMFFEREMDLAW